MGEHLYESSDKLVSHPDHYMSSGGMEAIDVIEEFTKDLSGIEATDTGNVIKYILRWKKKDGLRDLEKALWYLTHLISRVKMSKEREETVEETVLKPEYLRAKEYPFYRIVSLMTKSVILGSSIEMV